MLRYYVAVSSGCASHLGCIPQQLSSSTMIRRANGVHLVGSLPLDSADEVFTRVSNELSSQIKTLPDGETGDRWNFVFWQWFVFPSAILSPIHRRGKLLEEKSLKITLDDIKGTKYDEMAISSYQKFVELKKKGIIPISVRFQVSIPTPLNACWTAVDYVYRQQALPLYTERLLQDLRNIQDTIPNEDLAIQYDCAIEFAYLEFERGRIQDPFFKPHFSGIKDVILSQISRISSAVNQKVWLGYHLCYGDRSHRHFIEPQDASLLVNMATSIFSRVVKKHAVQWFHIPVPKDRTDAAYFNPFRDLDIGDAKLYLGLIREHDESGTLERLKMAQCSCPRPFGIATECGLGRTRKEDLDSVFSIARNLSNKADQAWPRTE